jgi:hypothetical protein
MAVEEAVGHKSHAPTGIGTPDLRPRHPPASANVAMRPLPPQMKPFLAVDPIGPLMIDAQALAPKQDLNPPISVPDPSLRDLDDPPPQGPVVLAVRAIPVG